MNDEDTRRVRRAARAIGLYVGVASGVVIAGGVGILVAVILSSSRREGAEHAGARPEHPGDDLVIDIDRLLPVVIVLGIAGVVLLGVIAWLTARRAVQPLGDALRAQRRFVADASHELRTPLTTLSSRIQLLQHRHERDEPIDEALAELRRDAAMMSDVLNDLLLAAESEADAVADVRTDVAAAVDAAADSLRTLAADDEVTLSVDHGATAFVALPAVTLTRLIVALVDNALQHSPAGGTVAVTTRREGGSAVVRVSDTGPGIVGIEVDRVFDRFARSTTSGRRRGFGLGLSLVRDVAERSGGTIEVESTSPDGTTFALRLPVAD